MAGAGAGRSRLLAEAGQAAVLAEPVANQPVDAEVGDQENAPVELQHAVGMAALLALPVRAGAAVRGTCQRRGERPVGTDPEHHQRLVRPALAHAVVDDQELAAVLGHRVVGGDRAERRLLVQIAQSGRPVERIGRDHALAPGEHL